MFMKQIAINKKVLIKSPTFITWTPSWGCIVNESQLNQVSTQTVAIFS